MKPSGIGGMAVIEGVMMKNKDEYAISVRKPNNEIVVEKKKHKNFSDKVKLFRLPIFRGILAFIDSMVIGIKVLNFSSSFFEEEDEKEKKEISEKTNALLMVLAVLASLGISAFLFMILPVLISNIFVKWTESVFLLYLFEGILRLVIFIGYVLAASQMKEIKRVFMYHGAEHKTINCLENGFELTVENVKWQSKAHKRCGTSFMLLVMLISLVFFMVLRPPTLTLRILSRVLLVPAIAGISYEFIRLAGKSENKIVTILSQPGLWMQALTTKEPDEGMIEVAISSVDAVFDWKGFLEKDETVASKEQSAKKNKSDKYEKSSAVKVNVKNDSKVKNNSEKLDQDPPKSEAKKSEAKKSEAKKSEAKKSEAKKSEAKKSEDKRSEAKKSEANKPEDKKSEAKKPEAKKPEDKKFEAKKPEDKKSEAKKIEAKKSEAKKPEDKKIEVDKQDLDILNEDNDDKKLNKDINIKKKDVKSEYAATSEIKIKSSYDNYEEDDEILRALDKYLDFNDDN
jgi:uncharacterized protein YqhQ